MLHHVDNKTSSHHKNIEFSSSR